MATSSKKHVVKTKKGKQIGPFDDQRAAQEFADTSLGDDDELAELLALVDPDGYDPDMDDDEPY